MPRKRKGTSSTRKRKGSSSVRSIPKKKTSNRDTRPRTGVTDVPGFADGTYLKALTLLGIRGFASEQRIAFAVPDGRPGSGLTVIVGENGAGKSTIIEAIRFLQRPEAPQFGEGLRNSSANGQVRIQFIDTSDRRAVLGGHPDGGGDIIWREAGIPLQPGQVFALPPRRALFEAAFQNVESDRARYTSSQELGLRGNYNQQFGGRLARMQNNRIEIDRFLRRVLEEAPQWTIEPTGTTGQFRLRVYTSSGPHLFDGIAEGVASLLFIADALYDSRPGSIIAIDEPELSLHASAQRRLAAVLSEYGATRQIVYATHSPHFANWDVILNGAQIVRAFRGARGSEVVSLTRDAVEAVRGFRENHANPHILGIDAREVFFLRDRIVLVEGLEDVVAFRLLVDELALPLGGEFYGWGVGGAGNMPIIARLLQELGFKSVVGILDKDKQADAVRLREMFPGFRFLLNPEEDIRTKVARTTPARAGLLDEHWRLREDRRHDAEQLLTQVKDALDGRLDRQG